MPFPVPTDFLCGHLITVQNFIVQNNEKACRMMIDAILLEVLKSEVNEKLLGFCDVRNDWEGPGFGYTGNVDYMIGSCSSANAVEFMDPFLLIVEAKLEWPRSAISQVLCEAGCLLKNRLADGKNTPVFAVLTNGLLFRFFAIDTDGVVYCSGTRLLEAGKDGTYKSSTSLSEILRWFYWFMTSIKSVSPGASNANLSEASIRDSLEKLRSCFGPRTKRKQES